ncbi:Endonuclease/exonuclease/phosphatase [Mycena floridula]|nr:Endonuclease/exonuclease/phosphatase [Mycena floridula]
MTTSPDDFYAEETATAIPAHVRDNTSSSTSSSYTTSSSFSNNSSISSESDHSLLKAAPPVPPRGLHRIPPPPPASIAAPPSPVIPAPPLPVRRTTILPELPNRPDLPTRPESVRPDSPASSPIMERKPFGKLPPPPTRTIGLTDRLPPVRARAHDLSSDEDSADEEDSKVDSLPDSSRSSRLPPEARFPFSAAQVHVTAYTGSVLVSGMFVIVASQQHIRIFDLGKQESSVFYMDSKEMIGVGHCKISAMEMKDHFHIWVGTKEGHLFEIDVRNGTTTSVKLAAHLHAVNYILRCGKAMLSMDDSGKVLVYSGNVQSAPRVLRVFEKVDFAKVVHGKLWTASKADMHGTTQRTPVIRVYDVNSGSAKSIWAPETTLGPVLSLAAVPSRPNAVYIGHQGGFVSVWGLEGAEGPKFVEAVKISSSDVLCLEGVNNRLWAGGRAGMISAYDVESKPWAVTNSWMAHSGALPVLKIGVDHAGIEKYGRLAVYSLGRDEKIHLWDGLLAVDWIDKELMKHEKTFSTFRNLRVLIVSWNADSARPEALIDSSFLNDALTSVDSPDIIVFGMQEVVDLESRKMTAKNVFMSGAAKKRDPGPSTDDRPGPSTGLSGLSDKVTGAYKRWYEHFMLAVKMAMPPTCPYTVIHTESLVGLFTCMFVKNSERAVVHDNYITTLKRGMGGRYGNKGGIITRLVIDDSSLCFINCHLAAGQGHVKARNADVAGILEDKTAFPASPTPLAYVGGGDGTMVLDHEIVFLNGDMNYRIDQRRNAIIDAVTQGNLDSIIVHDQLLKEIKFNKGFRLRGFSEGKLSFAPTYKYDRKSDQYDSSEKKRAPAWCDRVLWRTAVQERVKQLHYKRYEINVSDHRPISSAFEITVKKVRHDMMRDIRETIKKMWGEEQEEILKFVKGYYTREQLI